MALGGRRRRATRGRVEEVRDTGLVQTKTIAGVTVHEIVHTEAAFLIDSKGYQRALYLYPFRAQDVERTLRTLL